MKKIAPYLKEYTWLIIISFVLTFIQSMMQLLLPDFMSRIIDEGVMTGQPSVAYRVGLEMLGIAFAGMICAMVVAYLSSKIGAGFGARLRGATFGRVERFSLSQFGEFSTASLITRTTNDTQQISMFTVMLIRIVIMAPFTLIGGIIMIASKGSEGGSLSVVFAVVLPIIAAVIVILGMLATKLFKTLQIKVDRLSQVMREGLTGVRVIRAFNKDAKQTERFSGANRDLTDVSLKVNRIMAIIMPLMQLMLFGTQLAIIWLAAAKIESGTLSLGSMMAFIQYAFQILFSFLMFGMIFVMMPRASASASRIAEVLNSENIIHDPADPVMPEKLGTLRFENVCFGYPGAEQLTLEKISFEAKKGETVAIIGGTGSGKSTVANLILRFYDVSSGTVYVDGTDVKSMKQAELRRRIGYIPQTARLVSGTVADNIRFGNEDVTDEKIAEAAQIAQATDFIADKEDGLNSVIAQGGTNLSGGQKQRMAIARAIAKDPEIYLFDDSFSALDFRTDANLRAALKEYTSDATVIVIAQRINTILNADRIIVLDEGRVVGDGKHAQLMESCAIYRDIAASQLAGEGEVG